LSIASAAWPAIRPASSIVSCVTGAPGRIETIVSDASTSAGVAIGTDAPVQPRSRNGASSGALSAVSWNGSARRNSRWIACAPNGCGRNRIALAASSSRGSATRSARGSNQSRRSSGIRMSAASTSSTSTIVLVTASSVASSDRLCANEREIS